MCGIWSLVSMVSVVLCCGKISELSAQNIVDGFECCIVGWSDLALFSFFETYAILHRSGIFLGKIRS